MANDQKKKITDSFEKIYRQLGSADARQHAETLLAEFEKLQEKQSNVLSYLAGVNG